MNYCDHDTCKGAPTSDRLEYHYGVGYRGTCSVCYRCALLVLMYDNGDIAGCHLARGADESYRLMREDEILYSFA